MYFYNYLIYKLLVSLSYVKMIIVYFKIDIISYIVVKCIIFLCIFALSK